jgi:hypothetical protein
VEKRLWAMVNSEEAPSGVRKRRKRKRKIDDFIEHEDRHEKAGGGRTETQRICSILTDHRLKDSIATARDKEIHNTLSTHNSNCIKSEINQQRETEQQIVKET